MIQLHHADSTEIGINPSQSISHLGLYNSLSFDA